MLVLAALAGAVQGAGGQETLTWSEFREVAPAEPEARVVWGSAPDHHGELHLPEGDGPHPVVVLLHGGCWLSIADTGYMSHLARALRNAGWAVWAPEFRRVDMPGGEWPGILVDVGAGTDHLRTVAAEYSLDLDRVVLMGHSSGGHLALWLAGRRGLAAAGEEGVLRGREPLAVRGVVALSAIAGVAGYHALGGGGCGPDAVPTFLGGDPGKHPGRLRIAEPGARLAAGLPALPDGSLPVLLATGELDSVVPLAHARAFADEVGSSVRVFPVPGAGHFEVVAPWTPGFGHLWHAVVPFLAEVGGHSSHEGRR